jgi:hypothetical protein
MAQTPRPMPDAMQSETIIDSCSKLMKQLEELNKAVVGSMHEASDSGWDLAARLSRCHDPIEGARVYEEWLGSQRNMMVNEGRRFADMMFKLCDPDMMMPAIRGMREAREAMTSSMERSSRSAAAAE